MLWSSEKTHLVGGGEIVVVAYLLCLASVLLQIVEFCTEMLRRTYVILVRSLSSFAVDGNPVRLTGSKN